jgi:hypothetical protein
VGVLKNSSVNRETHSLDFSGFEPFVSPVIAYDDDLRIEGPVRGVRTSGFPPEFSYITPDQFELICKLGSRDLAKEFARRFVAMARDLSDWKTQIARVAANAENDPQEELHELVRNLLSQMAGEVGLSANHFHSDYEGNARREKQHHSYPLLGTWAHPDAAVLSPFRCAIEYDRQPAETNSSHLKISLGKTAAHVLSGAYDSAIQVYLLRPGTYQTEKSYTTDSAGTTKRFLARMEQMGVFLHVGRPSILENR